jgi:hypothetical protein
MYTITDSFLRKSFNINISTYSRILVGILKKSLFPCELLLIKPSPTMLLCQYAMAQSLKNLKLYEIIKFSASEKEENQGNETFIGFIQKVYISKQFSHNLSTPVGITKALSDINIGS